MIALIYSNVLVAVGAMSLALVTRVALGQPPALDALLALIGCATLLVYNLDRLSPHSLEDAHAPDARLRWLATHRRGLIWLTLAASVGVMVAASRLPWWLCGLLAPLALVSVAYSVPLVPTRRGLMRLKALPGSKLALIGLVWGVVTVSAPAWLGGVAPWQAESLWGMLAQALFIAAITLPFDVRDMARDASAGILTVPLLWGAPRARALALALASASALMFCLWAPALWPVWVGHGALTLAALWGARRSRAPHYEALWLDGLMLGRGLMLGAWCAL